MAGVDQPLQVVGAAVGVVGGVRAHAVVPPAAARRRRWPPACSSTCGDAEVDEVVELLDDRREGAVRGEGADVELVDHGRREGRRLPALVGPRERRVVDDLRTGPSDPLGLPRRAGVGRHRAVDGHPVAVAGGQRLHGAATIPQSRGSSPSLSAIGRRSVPPVPSSTSSSTVRAFGAHTDGAVTTQPVEPRQEGPAPADITLLARGRPCDRGLASPWCPPVVSSASSFSP